MRDAAPVARFRAYGTHYLKRLRWLGRRMKRGEAKRCGVARPDDRKYAIKVASREAAFWYAATARLMEVHRARREAGLA